MKPQKKKTHYVVWKGRKPGIYASWDACQRQTDGFAGARFRGYYSLEEALLAFKNPTPGNGPKKDQRAVSRLTKAPATPVVYPCICVDGAYSGNTGLMEWQCVSLPDGEIIFKSQPMRGTNNIAEFLAIVSALAHCKTHGITLPIYSDSGTARAWVRNRKAKTKLPATPENEPAHLLIQRAEKWLDANKRHNRVLTWDTATHGENPADYGRK